MENQPQDHLNQVATPEITSSELTQPRIQALDALYPLCQNRNLNENIINSLRNHLTPDIQTQLTFNPTILHDPALQVLFWNKLLPKLNDNPEYFSEPSLIKNSDGSFKTNQTVLNEFIEKKIKKQQSAEKETQTLTENQQITTEKTQALTSLQTIETQTHTETQKFDKNKEAWKKHAETELKIQSILEAQSALKSLQSDPTQSAQLSNFTTQLTQDPHYPAIKAKTAELKTQLQNLNPALAQIPEQELIAMSFASINKDLAPAFADRFSSQSSLQSFQTLFAPLTDSLKTLTPPIPEHESMMTALVMQSKAPAPLDLTKSSNHPSLANQLPKAFEKQTSSDAYKQEMAQEQSAVKEQFSAQLSPDALKETDPAKMPPLTRLVKHFPTSLLASAQSAHYPHGYESRMNTLFTSGSEHLPEKRFAGSPSYQQTKKLLCQSSNPNPIESKKESESMNNIFSYRETNSPKTLPLLLDFLTARTDQEIADKTAQCVLTP